MLPDTQTDTWLVVLDVPGLQSRRRGASFIVHAMTYSAPTTHSFEFIEQMDEANDALGWPVEYRQLLRGPFSSRVTSLESDSWFLFDEKHSNHIELQAGSLDGVFVFALVDGPPAVVNGGVVSRDTIFLQGPGSEVRVNLAPGFRATQMGVPAEELEDAVFAMAPDLPIPLGRSSLIPTAPGSLEHALRAMRKALFAPSSREATRNEAVSGILTEIVGAMADHGKAAVSTVLRGSAARRSLSRAREYIEAHLDQTIRIAAVCRYAGTTLRTLERIFARELGVSPQQYVKARRLNAVRHRLLVADRGQRLRVTEAAMGYGFVHMGRFAVDYRCFFGESPSETLRRP